MDIHDPLEDLLLRVVPGLTEQWEGATPEEIARIEQEADGPLPPFYRWFLARMGRSMGPIYCMDLSVKTILELYDVPDNPDDNEYDYDEDDLEWDGPLIGHSPDVMCPTFLYYDLSCQRHGDALVQSNHGAHAGTLREMIAQAAMQQHVLTRFPQTVQGFFSDHNTLGQTVPGQLLAALGELGFTCPIETSAYSGLFEHDAAAFVCSTALALSDADDVQFWGFEAAANDARTLMEILDAITAMTHIETSLGDGDWRKTDPKAAWKPPVEVPPARELGWKNVDKRAARAQQAKERATSLPLASADRVAELDRLLISPDPQEQHIGLEALEGRPLEQHTGALLLLAHGPKSSSTARKRAERLLRQLPEPYSTAWHRESKYVALIMEQGREPIIRTAFEQHMDEAQQRLEVWASLTCLPGWLADYPLTSIRLVNCAFTALPPVLLELPNLTRLELYNSPVDDLSPLCELRALTELSLRSMRLDALPPAIGRLTALETLGLMNNRLTALPDELGELSELCSLDVSENQLTALPESLDRIGQLKELDASVNPLEALPAGLALCLEVAELRRTHIPDEQLKQLLTVLNKQEAPSRTRQLQWHLLFGQIEAALALASRDDLIEAAASAVPAVRTHAVIALEQLAADAALHEGAIVACLGQLWFDHGALAKRLRSHGVEVQRGVSVRTTHLALGEGLNEEQFRAARQWRGPIIGAVHLQRFLDEHTAARSVAIPALSAAIKTGEQRRARARRPTIDTEQAAELGQLEAHGAPHQTLTDVFVSYMQTEDPTARRLLMRSGSSALRSFLARGLELGAIAGTSDPDSFDAARCRALGLDPLVVARRVMSDYLAATDYLTRHGTPEDQKNLLSSHVYDGDNLHFANYTRGLRILPPEIGELTDLVKVHLNDNELETLPDTIGNLTRLTHLSISTNKLTGLPESLKNLRRLTTLELSRNPLETFPAVLLEMPWLEQLELHGVQLAALPPDIDRLANLRELGLSGNALTCLPEALAAFSNIGELNLTASPLRHVPPVLFRMPSLRELDLVGCGLTEIPTGMRQMTGLRVLNLKRNKLTQRVAEIQQILPGCTIKTDLDA